MSDIATCGLLSEHYNNKPQRVGLVQNRLHHHFINKYGNMLSPRHSWNKCFIGVKQQSITQSTSQYIRFLYKYVMSYSDVILSSPLLVECVQLSCTWKICIECTTHFKRERERERERIGQNAIFVPNFLSIFCYSFYSLNTGNVS